MISQSLRQEQATYTTLNKFVVLIAIHKLIFIDKKREFEYPEEETCYVSMEGVWDTMPCNAC